MRALALAVLLAAAPARADVVLLFDKACAHCTVCRHADQSGRRIGSATLTVLERQDGRLVPIARWPASYGAHEGYKVRLKDLRTPEGLYHTTWINDQTHNDDPIYGFVSITTDYPSEEDRLSCQPEQARLQCTHDGETACADPGGDISIHGGMSRPTAGCIRLLDPHPDASRCHGKLVNCQSIAELVALLRAKPGDGRVPLISVRQAARSCQSPIGSPIGPACASAIERVLAPGPRPTRAQVNAWVGAGEAPPPERSAVPVAPAAVAVAEVAPDALALKPEGVWATSEAPLDRCAAGGAVGQTCGAERIIDGDASTAWCEAVDGPGIGEWVTFQFAERHAFSHIRIKNGNWRGGRSGTQWTDQGYVERLDIAINGRHVRCEDPNGDPSELDCDVDGLEGSQVTLRIERAAAGDASMDTCISEIVFERKER